jgi:hypothetical protein
MIFKSTIGTGVTGTLRYMRGQGRDEEGKRKDPGQSRATLLGGQGFGFDPDDDRRVDIARRMMEHNAKPEMQGVKDFYCAKDALHISLSWAPGQTPDRIEKIEAGQTFLKALGMENSMALFYDHNDKSYAHIHVVASRVNPETGMAYEDHQRLYRGMHCAIEWERARDQVTKPRQWQHDLADVTRGEVDRDKLKELLLKNEATIPKHRLDMALAFGGRFGNHLDAEREAFVQHHDLIRLKKYRSGRTAAYTTQEIYQGETMTLATARRLKEQAGFGVPQKTLKKHADSLTLTEEQREALWHTTRDNGLALISGEAGTGKSRTLQAVRKAYQDQGYRVRGLAFTNKVTQNLQRDGFDSSTIASELLALKNGHSRWNDKTVLVIDEAAQLSTSDLDNLLRQAESRKVKMILAGHDKQLGAIEKGGLFPVMERRFGSTRLTEVMRTKDPEQKRAYNKMANRKFDEAIEIFRKSDSIRWHDTKAESVKALTEEYTKDFLEHPDKTRQIIASTNDEVRELNEFARNLRKEHGLVKKEREIETAKGKRMIGIGDRIAMNETPNNRETKAKGLINGAFGTVVDMKDKDGKPEITMDLDRPKGQQRRTFKLKIGEDKEKGEVNAIDHGYAGTAYKAQGDTLHRTYVLHKPQATAPSNYVALSRHVEKTRIYVSREEASSFSELSKQMGHGPDKTAAHSYLVHEGDHHKIERPKPSVQPERTERPEPTRSKVLDRLLGKKKDVSRSPEREVEREVGLDLELDRS